MERPFGGVPIKYRIASMAGAVLLFATGCSGSAAESDSNALPRPTPIERLSPEQQRAQKILELDFSRLQGVELPVGQDMLLGSLQVRQTNPNYTVSLDFNPLPRYLKECGVDRVPPAILVFTDIDQSALSDQRQSIVINPYNGKLGVSIDLERMARNVRVETASFSAGDQQRAFINLLNMQLNEQLTLPICAGQALVDLEASKASPALVEPVRQRALQRAGIIADRILSGDLPPIGLIRVNTL